MKPPHFEGHRDPSTLPPREQFLYRAVAELFVQLLTKKDYTILEIDAMCMGLCRKSMEEVLGIPEAAQWDKEARERIGWPI